MDPVDLYQVSSILIPCAKAGRLQMNLQTAAHAFTCACRLSSRRVSDSNEQTPPVRAVNLLASSNEQTPTSTVRAANPLASSTVGRMVILCTPERNAVDRLVKPGGVDVHALADVFVCVCVCSGSDSQ